MRVKDENKNRLINELESFDRNSISSECHDSDTIEKDRKEIRKL